MLETSIKQFNLQIYLYQDIKATLAGNKIFSKMDIRIAFWQTELYPDSRYLTLFHANDKL